MSGDPVPPDPRLLRLLDPNLKRADEKYEALCEKLERYFEWRGCEDAGDLAQDTILRVLQNAAEGTVTFTTEDVTPFFYGVARNVLFEARRDQTRAARHVELQEDTAQAPSAFSQVDARLLLEQVLRLMEPRDRDLLLRVLWRRRARRAAQAAVSQGSGAANPGLPGAEEADGEDRCTLEGTARETTPRRPTYPLWGVVMTRRPDNEENLMRRFLVGQATPEEQALVDDRLASDPDYFDTLCAVEEELMLAHARGELADEWKSAFEAHVLGSPRRRARAERVSQFAAAVAEAGRTLAHEDPARRAWLGLPRPWAIAAAAAIVAAVATALLVIGPSSGGVATLVLAPGLSRAESGQANLFKLPPGLRQVRLETTLPGTPEARVRATVQPVGGQPLAVPADPVATPTPAGLRVTWLVPASILAPGDYLLILRSEGGEVLGSFFFTLEAP